MASAQQKLFFKAKNSPQLINESSEEPVKDTFENSALFTLEKVANYFIVWPSNRPAWLKWLVIAYIALNFHIQCIIYLFVSEDLALEKIIAFGELSYGWLFYSKMISGIVHNEKLRKVMDDIRLMWKKCSNLDIPEWQEIYKEHNNFIQTLTLRVLRGLTIIGQYYCIAPVAGYFAFNAIGKQVEYRYGVHIFSIFYYRSNLKVALTLTFFASFGVFFWITLSGFYILMPPLIMSYICKLFNMVQTRLLNLNKLHGKISEEELLKELASIVEDHVTTIDFCKRYEKTIRVAFLVVNMNAVGIFCVLTFSFQLMDLSESSSFQLGLALIGFISVIVTDIWLSSYYGTLLLEESTAVAIAAYSTVWYEMSPKVRKYILMIIQRANRPVGLTIAQFSFISLETFAQVLKASMSYLALARSVFL